MPATPYLLTSLLALSLPLAACTPRGPSPAGNGEKPAEAVAAAPPSPSTPARPLSRSTGAVALEVLPQFDRISLFCVQGEEYA